MFRFDAFFYNLMNSLKRLKIYCFGFFQNVTLLIIQFHNRNTERRNTPKECSTATLLTIELTYMKHIRKSDSHYRDKTSTISCEREHE